MKFIWNVDKTRSVKATTIKEFIISSGWLNSRFGVRAFITANDYITVFEADTAQECEDWINATTKDI